MEFNIILNWLLEHNFEVKHSELFYPRYVFCKKGRTNAVIAEYSKDNMADQIRSDSVDIRAVLNRLGENVWNTYFLICTSTDEIRIPYSIEKDSIGLRKYVINSENDFKRVPFLDKVTVPPESPDYSNVINIHSSKDEKLNSMIDYIISTVGLQRNLNDNEVAEVLQKFYGLELTDDED